jgi:transposase
MFNLPLSTQIFVAVERVDGRLGIDGLAAHVQSSARVKDALYGGHLFVFFSKRADRARVLYWDHNGFVLVLKRLEKGTFRTAWPSTEEDWKTVEYAELVLILEGIELAGSRRRPRWIPHSASP